MDDSIIPKADNTSEIIRDNLLKTTYISKRHALRKNKIPANCRNNIKSATIQLENEQAELLANVNVVLQKSKLRQDYQNQIAIFNLYKQKKKADRNINYLRKFLFDLNKEISRLQSIDDRQQKINNAVIKTAKEQKFINDIEKLLLEKNHMYNKDMKELGDLRQTLDGLLKKLSNKNLTYDKMVRHLEKESKYLSSIGECALNYQEKKEKALNNLTMFRETNTPEARQWELRVNAANYKLKGDLELSEFLQKKRSERRNNRKTSPAKVIKISNENEDLSKAMKHLIHISGETDLKIITEHIGKMSYDKASLFHLIIFIEKQLTELEHSLCHYKSIGMEKKESNNDRNIIYDNQLKMILINIQKNEDTINSIQKMMKNVNSEYKRLIEKIYDIFKMFGIDPSSYKELGLSEPINEENMFIYFKEMEKRSFEILFKLNIVESSCLTGPSEDPLMSDVESTQDLLKKDYNGIEIKLNKVLDIGDSSKNQRLNHNIDDEYLPFT